MDKQQILSQISEILKIAHLQIDVLNKNPEKFSALEADLVKDYLRIAYDKLNVLTYLAAKETKEAEMKKTQKEEKTETPKPQTSEVSSMQQEKNTDQSINIPFAVEEPVLNTIETPEHENEIEEKQTIEDASKTSDDSQADFIWNMPKKEDSPATQEAEHKEFSSSKPSSVSQIVAETFHENDNTVIGKMEKDVPDNSVLSKVSKIRIDELKKAIGINDRFLFINELFQGNISSYTQFIDDLDKFDDSLKAWEYIEKMKSKKSWDSASSAYKRLFEIVERKFL